MKTFLENMKTFLKNTKTRFRKQDHKDGDDESMAILILVTGMLLHLFVCLLDCISICLRFSGFLCFSISIWFNIILLAENVSQVLFNIILLMEIISQVLFNIILLAQIVSQVLAERQDRLRACLALFPAVAINFIFIFISFLILIFILALFPAVAINFNFILSLHLHSHLHACPQTHSQPAWWASFSTSTSPSSRWLECSSSSSG